MTKDGDEAMSRTTRITLGPVYYLWGEDKWRDFYLRVADEAPVDRVVIGETVCSKRSHFHQAALADVLERLAAAGKEVVLSTLALVTLDREIKAMSAAMEDPLFPIEANDLAALQLACHPHMVGPLVNVYNAPTARLLFRRGAMTICLPPELPFASVSAICRDLPGKDFEVMAFGRLPLAISARCAHARAKGRSKDNCQFVCGEEPDGLPLMTLDRQSFLVLNGVQTVSQTCQVLLGELPDIEAAGVCGIRLSPQDCDMVRVADIYRAVLDGQMDVGAGLAELGRIYPSAPFSNGFHHSVEGAKWVQALKTA
jgi:O2-independent ubiquinone biosynthesis protein UbiV